jgi:putative chitinase
MITAAQLAAVMPKVDPGRWLGPLNAAVAEYSIDKDERTPMFLAQVAAETTGLTVLEENLSYSVARLIAVWPRHFNDANAQQYAGRPDALADFIYANRNGNGPEASGDGWLFHGRGGLMLTGRANYSAAGFSLGVTDLTLYPDQVATAPIVAMRTAAWYWAQSGCNQLADAGDFEGVTRAINGGLIGLAQRVAYWQTAQGAMA